METEQRPTSQEERARWRSCWRDTSNALIVGEIEDAKFGLRLIADVERQAPLVEELVGALGALQPYHALCSKTLMGPNALAEAGCGECLACRLMSALLHVRKAQGKEIQE